MRGLLLLILLLPSLAQADDAELAARAQSVHEERCASIKRGSGALAADAMVEVAQVWGALEQASTTSAEPYINY